MALAIVSVVKRQAKSTMLPCPQTSPSMPRLILLEMTRSWKRGQTSSGDFVNELHTSACLTKRSDVHDLHLDDNSGCDHNSNPSDTFPSDGSLAYVKPPDHFIAVCILTINHGTNQRYPCRGQGTYGSCYSAPTGVNWNRVEIDVFFPSGSGKGIQAFCNVNCQGGASIKQQNINCYLPISG